MSKLLIYTDGSSRGNPGPGGWGVVMKFNDKTKELSGGEKFTTNNRMELMAVIEALEAVKSTRHPVEVYSDSKYVIETKFGGKKYLDTYTEFSKNRIHKN